MPCKVIILSWRSFLMTSSNIYRQKLPFRDGCHFQWYAVIFRIYKAITEWHFKWHLVLFSPKMAFLSRMYCQMKSSMIYNLKWSLWATCHFKRHQVLLTVYRAHSDLDVISSDINHPSPSKVAIFSRMSFLMASSIIYRVKCYSEPDVISNELSTIWRLKLHTEMDVISSDILYDLPSKVVILRWI